MLTSSWNFTICVSVKFLTKLLYCVSPVIHTFLSTQNQHLAKSNGKCHKVCFASSSRDSQAEPGCALIVFGTVPESQLAGVVSSSWFGIFQSRISPSLSFTLVLSVPVCNLRGLYSGGKFELWQLQRWVLVSGWEAEGRNNGQGRKRGRRKISHT